MSIPSGNPPPSKGPLILLGVAIGAIGMLMLVILVLAVLWVGFSAYRSHSVPAQPVPMQPQFDPLAAEPPGMPPGPINRRPPPDRMTRVERVERIEQGGRMDRAEVTELPAPETPASVAPVLHLRSPGGNLLDGKSVVLETAGKFRASDGYVQVADSPALRISGPMTISIWFNARSFDRAITLGSRALNGPPWQFPYSSWLVRINNDTHFEASLAGRGTYSPSTWLVTRLVPGQWYHAVMTFDGSMKRFYLNGEQQRQLASGLLVLNSPIANTPGRAILIGADESESPVGDLFDGAIDDVRLFNRALPGEEILELFTKSAKAGEGGTGKRL